MKYEDLLQRFPAPKFYARPGVSLLHDEETLAQACAMLERGCTALAVSLACEYSTLSTFSDAFLRVTGVRPSAWKLSITG